MRPAGILIAMAIVSMIVGGCWDRREPEELIAALAIGFDIDDEGLYDVVIQYSNPSTITGAEGGGQGGSETESGGGQTRTFWTYSAKGRTPFEAIRNLAPEVTRLTTLSHIQILLISEKLARHGIGPIVDLYERNMELRPSVISAVVEGDLKHCLDMDLPLEIIPATGLARLFRLIASERSMLTNGKFLDKIILLGRPGQEVTITRLQVLGESGDQKGNGTQHTGSPSPPVRVHGGSAFRGEKMVGWLDMDESRGWNWIMGKVRRGPMLIPVPERNSIITLDLIGSKSVVTPVIKGKDISIRLEIKACSRIEDETNLDGKIEKIDFGDPDIIRMLREGFSKDVREKTEIALARAKDLKADIFGFGNLVYRKHPKVWKDWAGDNWGEIFENIEVEIDIETKISRPGLIMSPGIHH